MAPTEIGTHDPPGAPSKMVPGARGGSDLGVVGTWALGSSKIAPGPTNSPKKQQPAGRKTTHPNTCTTKKVQKHCQVHPYQNKHDSADPGDTGGSVLAPLTLCQD